MPDLTPAEELREASRRIRVAGAPRAFLLAVADWLDATAKEADEYLTLDNPEGPCCAELPNCTGHGEAWACERCGVWLDDGCGCFGPALRVARAYLSGAGSSVRPGPESTDG